MQVDERGNARRLVYSHPSYQLTHFRRFGCHRAEERNDYDVRIATTMGGFVLVIVPTHIAIVDGRNVNRQIDDELRDVSAFAEQAGGIAR